MSNSSSIQVVVRLRPMNSMEQKHGTLPVVTASTADKSVTVIKGIGAKQMRSQFVFDNVFTSFSTQEEVFNETLKPVIGDIFKGYESTVFAYGQTGTGKTHTMEGDLSNTDQHGVIPRAAAAIFEELKQPQYSQDDTDVQCSYLEIYNEELGDLLALEEGETTKITMMESKSSGVFCKGLSTKKVRSATDVLQLMQKAETKRRVGETKMNKHSSRSHCIFTMTIKTVLTLADGSTMAVTGKLHMVDLAGSECAKTAGGDKRARERERERMNINQSLLTLGRVISILKEQSQRKRPNTNVRIPYRDSKLTRILQESLGGRCKTVIIATLSPSVTAIEESMSTLNYAQSAAGIINKPISTSYISIGANRSTSSDKSGSGSDNDQQQTSESWLEMECRLNYMQSQVDEAQAALARKHLQQQELIESAEKAEAEKLELEKKHHDLTLTFNSVKEELAVEKDMRIKTESKLAESQLSLKRTSAILRATQQTEINLTREATALLDGLKASIADGDALHSCTVGYHKAEVERTKAAREFQIASLAVLEETAAALNELSESTLRSHTEAIVQAANGTCATQNKLFKSTQALVKGISTNVQLVTANMKAQMVGLPNEMEGQSFSTTLSDMSEIVKTGLDEVTTSINQGEESLAATCMSAKTMLTDCATRVQALEKTYKDCSEQAASTLTANMAENTAKLHQLISSASKSLADASKGREKRRKEHSLLLSSWRTSSIEAADSLEDVAKNQSESVQKELVSFTDDTIGRHDTVRNVLLAQRNFVAEKGCMHVETVSKQQAALLEQGSFVSIAKEQQQKLRDAMVQNIMVGVQDLVNQQMAIMAAHDEKNMDTLEQSNKNITNTNNELTNCTNELKLSVEEANQVLTAETQTIHTNDVRVNKMLETTRATLDSLASNAKKHGAQSISFANKAEKNILQLGKYDTNTNKAVLKSVEQDGQACLLDMEDTTLSQAMNSIANLKQSCKDISAYTESTIIPNASDTLNGIGVSRKDPMEVFGIAMNRVRTTFVERTKKLGELAKDQGCAAERLCASVDSKLNQLKDTTTEQSKSIDYITLHLAELAEQNASSTESSLAACTSKLSTTKTDIDNFAVNVLRVNEKVDPLPKRQKHSYSNVLSATPEDAVIIGELGEEEEKKKEVDLSSESMDAVESCSQAHDTSLSHDSINASAESSPAESSPAVLTTINVNSRESLSPTGETCQLGKNNKRTIANSGAGPGLRQTKKARRITSPVKERRTRKSRRVCSGY